MAVAFSLRTEKKKKTIIFLYPILQFQFSTSQNMKAERNGKKNPVKILCQPVMNRCMEFSQYATLLQSCVNNRSLLEGKLVHAHIIQAGLEHQNMVISNKILSMYAKCGCMDNARNVFDKMSQRDVASWTVIIAGYARQGHATVAMKLFHEMQQTGTQPNQFTFSGVLPACADVAAVKDVHDEIIRCGFESDVFVGVGLVNRYGKIGNLKEARHVFDKMSERDVVSWNAMVAGYAQNGYYDEALLLFHKMQRMGIDLDQFSFASVIPACTSYGVLREVHGEIVKCGFEGNVFVENALVNMYGKCGSIEDAHNMFVKMPQRNVISWTAMISGYMQNGHANEALKLFWEMPEQNVVSWNAVIVGYTQHGYLDEALEMFQRMPDRDIVSWNTIIAGYVQNGYLEEAINLFEETPERDMVTWNVMIAGYAQNGDVDEALRLFQRMPERNVVSWTAMIAGYVQNGFPEEALQLFREMERTGVKPNSETFASVLPACANLTDLQEGREIHEEIIKARLQADVFVGNALVDMYAKCGSIEYARQVFDKIPKRDITLWNSMISGYAHNGLVDEAFKLFQKMPVRNVVSWNAMIAGLAQNGCMDDSLVFFYKMPIQDSISWTAIIAGYVQNGHFDKALELFQQMRLLGIEPISETFASILPACANLAVLFKGKEIHEDMIRCGFESNISAGNALVDTYAKCGSKEDARKVFDKMCRRDVVSWNAMIVGCAMNGCGNEALDLFEQMQHSCMQPNQITFVGVLSACCHAGLVDLGWQHFDSMEHNYNITPTIEHFCCMVDLLGRAGRLDEAHNLINNMPLKPDAAVWASLLGACRVHSNIKLGERVADHLFESNPKVAAHYVLLSNIYAAAGRWDDVEKVRELMKDKRVKKMPGRSWIEVNNKMHTFIVGSR